MGDDEEDTEPVVEGQLEESMTADIRASMPFRAKQVLDLWG